MSKTFDLSTLNLSAGTHEITVKARASGYLDSAPSNAVSYVVAEETTYKLSGTYLFDEHPTSPTEELTQNVTFISNYDETFNRIDVDISGDTPDIFYYGDNSTLDGYAYRVEEWGGWETDDCRSITFDGEQSVSQEFYDWFTANAVKQ